MALQIEVFKVSVKDAGAGFDGKLLNVTMNLKCWNEGDNTETDPAVLDKDFSGEYKSVDGLTVQQQINKMIVIIHALMQAAIDTYKLETSLLANALLDAAVTTIQTNLVG